VSMDPTIVIRFDGESTVFQPGDTISGQYWIESLDAGQLKAAELSILWRTDGKGDEDMAVHEFGRCDGEDQRPLDPVEPRTFCTTLPNSPLSYEGRIVKLRWCVRVRAFLARGKELLGERTFQLGRVPPARSDAILHMRTTS
jgi:hypothetical protein